LSSPTGAELEIDAILDWAYVDDAISRQRRIDLTNKLPILAPLGSVMPSSQLSI
jgi:hypothetical protein